MRVEDHDFKRVWMGATDKILRNIEEIDGKIPHFTTDRKGKYLLNRGGGWTDSFWVGMLYLAYSCTGNMRFLECASRYQHFFKLRAENSPETCRENRWIPLDHDTGFIFSLSQVARFKLLGDREAESLAISAARVLISRYHEKGQFIRAWDDWEGDTEEFRQEKKGKMIVDSLMNMPLLMWAYSRTGEVRFKEIAVNHTNTVKKYIVRNDFSTYHTFNFDPSSGMPLSGRSAQGYADESCWSRGQAWAIYGFALMYGYTGDEEYLSVSIKLADYFIQRLTPFMIPCWDFDAEDLTFRPWDSSAACIAASGILEISRYIKNPDLRNHYREIAKDILAGVTNYCSTYYTPECQALILHGCSGPAYKKKDPGEIANHYLDTPLIFGDYFYLECLAKICCADRYESFW